jgi:hypothetical protein
MKKEFPESVVSCLWSYDIENMDIQENKDLIITQILNHGVWYDIKWLYSVYSERDIKRVVMNPARGMWFPKALNFWQTVLDIKIDKKIEERALIKQ